MHYNIDSISMKLRITAKNVAAEEGSSVAHGRGPCPIHGPRIQPTVAEETKLGGLHSRAMMH